MQKNILTLLLISGLLQLASCMQAESVDRNKCLTSNNQSIDCSQLTVPELSTNFRKKYIAEINIPISFENGILTFLEDGSDKDSDIDYNCEILADSGKSFRALIQDKQLHLRDGDLQIQLTREDGFTEDELNGTWSMTEETTMAQIVTELVVYNTDHIKIRKTCNLR
jgi:hypothetical protein